MDQLIRRIEQLEAANTELARQLADLRARVDLGGGYQAMRDARRCPACGGDRIIHVRRATQASHARVLDLGLVHERSWTGARPRGAMESFACRGCGLVELHAIDFVGVRVDGETVVAVEPVVPPPNDGPFR